MLFAQVAPAPAPAPPALPPNFWAIILGVCGCYLLVLILLILIAVFFCRTLSRVMNLCHPDNQAMSPGLVWLNLVPCVNYVWLFVTVVQVANTLQLEFRDRRLDEEESDYGRMVGLSLAGLNIVSIFANMAANVVADRAPFAVLAVGGVITVVWIVLFVLYWVRIAGYGRQLVDDDEAHDRAADEYDDRLPPEESADDRRD